MMNIYLVKSFGCEGYTNLKAFSNQEQAEAYADEVMKQIPIDVLESGNEFVEVEEVSYVHV
jgi:hypothetical protein